jgi:hypothetical protein
MIGEVANAPDPVNPIQMARPERFELPTTWFEAKCSIQLSYGRVGLEYIQLAVIVHGEITRPLRGLALRRITVVAPTSRMLPAQGPPRYALVQLG